MNYPSGSPRNRPHPHETYGISTWRWAKVLAWVWLFGMALRLVVT